MAIWVFVPSFSLSRSCFATGAILLLLSTHKADLTNKYERLSRLPMLRTTKYASHNKKTLGPNTKDEKSSVHDSKT